MIVLMMFLYPLSLMVHGYFQLDINGKLLSLIQQIQEIFQSGGTRIIKNGFEKDSIQTIGILIH